MSENIKFTADSARGLYAKNDTGVLVGFLRDYTDGPCAVVRLTDNSYVQAPLGDLEYVAAEE